MDLTFGVTGAGKVGASFVKAFGAVGLRCAGIYGGAYADKKAKLLGEKQNCLACRLLRRAKWRKGRM